MNSLLGQVVDWGRSIPDTAVFSPLVFGENMLPPWSGVNTWVETILRVNVCA